MKKILRNLSTERSKAFWESAVKVAAQVDEWPASKRAGINVSVVRTTSPKKPDVSAESGGQPTSSGG